MNYCGVIIEESLIDKDVLKHIKIISTKVEQVTEKHQTPHLQQWTLHSFEIVESAAEKIAEALSQSLRAGTAHDTWYADFKNETYHVIVFPNKVFKVDRRQPEEYAAVVKYGRSLGIPEHQLDFSPDIKEWKR